MARGRFDWVLGGAIVAAGAVTAGALALLEWDRKAKNAGNGPGGGSNNGGAPGSEPANGSSGPAGPCQRGAYVRSLTRGSLDEVRSWIKDAGLTSLTVNLGWQRKPGGDKATEKFVSKAQGDRVRALRQDGIKIDAWAWVRPGAASELNEWIREARDLWGGLDAVCLNAEAPWYPSSNLVRAGFVQAAREYVDFVRAGTGVKVGLTTYGGGPALHPKFPWEGFEGVQYVVPQWYDSKHRLAAGYEERFAKTWETVFPHDKYRWEILLGASNAHDKADMIRHLERARAAAPWVQKFQWWDLYWLSISKDRRAAVNEVCRVAMG